jgi:glycosyltransferase involved in cell wall biosynthesis
LHTVKNQIIACIPAYNEEKTIANVITKTQKYVDRVIVCDDGSQDTTLQIVKRLDVDVLIHEKNMGKGEALKTLFIFAKQLNPTVIITLDADGQHDPDELPRFIDPINKGFDVVIGSRYVDGSWNDAPFYRLFGLKIINSLFLIKGVVKDTQNGYRAYSTRALDVVMQCKAKGYGIETEQLVRVIENGLKIIEVPITAHYKGLPYTSKMNPISHGLNLVAIAIKLRIQHALAYVRAWHSS